MLHAKNCPAGKMTVAIDNGFGGVISVSYTHLDVYKRQVTNDLNICGYRISANTPAFQAGKVGSIPTTRSILKYNKLIKNV